MKHHIFITDQGGVAEVCEDTLPPGVVVEILTIWKPTGERDVSLVSGTARIMEAEP